MIRIEEATLDDVPRLVELETVCFKVDRLSARSFRRFVRQGNSHLIVARENAEILAYALLLFHQGTAMARLYSIAVSPKGRGKGLGSKLLEACEEQARKRKTLSVRLEVARENHAAHALYIKHGYRAFGNIPNYYEDGGDAIRMQKQVLHAPEQMSLRLPFYAQSTDFTCGPACLLMALTYFGHIPVPSRLDELDIWRDATTIFMLSGHGLAIAAVKRGLEAEVYVNREGALFVDSVRGADKKAVLESVHEGFQRQIDELHIPVFTRTPDVETLKQRLSDGWIPIILVSTWRLNQNKTPHWTIIAGFDDDFVYIHDPEIDNDMTPEEQATSLGNIYVPITWKQLGAMISYGRSQLKTAVFVRKPTVRAQTHKKQSRIHK